MVELEAGLNFLCYPRGQGDKRGRLNYCFSRVFVSLGALFGNNLKVILDNAQYDFGRQRRILKGPGHFQVSRRLPLPKEYGLRKSLNFQDR